MDEKNLGVLSKLIRTAGEPKFKEYLFNEHNPRKLLQTLQRVAKPSKATLRQLLEADLERLEIGPKRLGVESWLNLYTKILTKGKRIDTLHARLLNTPLHPIMRSHKPQHFRSIQPTGRRRRTNSPFWRVDD